MEPQEAVWVQLYIGQEKKGNPFAVYNFTGNVDQLTKAVKEEWGEDLPCRAPELAVYKSGTAVPVPEGKDSIDPRKKVSENYKEGETLIVVAPQPQQQRQESVDPGHPFVPSIYILYSKPSVDEITVIATAFAVSDTLAFTAGHTVSEINEKGDVLVIDEPLFLTTVLVRDGNVVSPEQGKPTISVKVAAFHYENDWAVLKRTDSEIFPQWIPVAKSEKEVPKAGAVRKLTFYHCPVTLFRDDVEYTDRLHVTPKIGSVGLIKKNSIDFQNGGFDGSCGGPYVYMGKAVAIHTLSQNSALTSEALRIHQVQELIRTSANKRMKVADVVTVADSVAASHTSVGTGILIYKRMGLLKSIA